MKISVDQLRKATWLPLMMVITALLLTGCSKDNLDDNETDPGQSYTVRGDADGAKVVPAVSTSGTALLTGTYYKGSNKLDYEITWTSLSGTAMAIGFRGPALEGENGALLFSVDISAGATAGTRGGSITLTDQQEGDFMLGKHYFTIITSAEPNGEVRGQIFPLIR